MSHARRDHNMLTLTDALRSQLRARCTVHIFATWFAEIRCETFDDVALVVSVPDEFKRAWIESHYANVLCDAAAASCGAAVRVELAVRAQP